MYKSQLQQLAQRSCFNLPSYTCIREGPDHAPRFKAAVNFNGETFECPSFCTTLRQAEHSAAEVALHSLSTRGPSHSLAARLLDEIGVHKNLLQEIAQRAGAPLPRYTTFRSGLGHRPVFTGTVELTGITFTGEYAKNKKQAEKNVSMAAWTSLKQLAKETVSSSSEPENNDELEQITIAQALLNYRIKEKMAMVNSSNAPIPFTMKFPIQNPRPTSPQPSSTTSKILPLICRKVVHRNRYMPSLQAPAPESLGDRMHKFPAAGAASNIPIQQFKKLCHGIAPAVTVRTAVPVFSAPTHPPPSALSLQPPTSAVPCQQGQNSFPSQPPQSAVSPQPPISVVPTQQLQSPLSSRPPQSAVSPQQPPSSLTQLLRISPVHGPTPVTIRQAIPVFASPVQKKDPLLVRNGDGVTAPSIAYPLPPISHAQVEEGANTTAKNLQVCETVQSLEQLKI